MYIIALDGHSGYDTVLWVEGSIYKTGDLIKDTQGLYLCLGYDIAFPELYIKTKAKPYVLVQGENVIPQLMRLQTIECIHWLVQKYYSSYKHVVALFLPQGVEKSKTKIVKTYDTQSCILFPDIRTLSQTFLSKNDKQGTAILHGGMTLPQKRKLFWQIRNGEIQTLLATNRGLFFQRDNLQNITIYQPTNRAYSSQSDPRFVIQEVAQKIADVYSIKSIEYII